MDKFQNILLQAGCRDLIPNFYKNNSTIAKITKVIYRHYSDNDQDKVYVEWIDSKGKTGRTEGEENNGHMQALIQRAKREKAEIVKEKW